RPLGAAQNAAAISRGVSWHAVHRDTDFSVEDRTLPHQSTGSVPLKEIGSIEGERRSVRTFPTFMPMPRPGVVEFGGRGGGSSLPGRMPQTKSPAAAHPHAPRPA